VARYRRKISRPLLDRIDLHVEVPAVPPDEMAAWPRGDSSDTIRARVIDAWARQLARQGKPNALLSIIACSRSRARSRIWRLPKQ